MTSTLWLVLGDQLDPRVPVLKRHLDRERDAVLMAEVEHESRHVASHKQRTTLFLSAMRHHAERLRALDVRLRYVALDDDANTQSLDGELTRAIAALRPHGLAVTRPGEWRVLQLIQGVADRHGLPLTVHEDPHFLLTPDEFSAWASGRKELVLEHFYRMMRRRLGILVNERGDPEGGSWNYDAENRKRFAGDRSTLPPRVRHEPDALTRDVTTLVSERLADLPGAQDDFNWPVTRTQALAELRDFVRHRLRHFGDFQDAMVAGAPWLYHALLSPALNLKLIDPRETVRLALEGYRRGMAPLNAVEGFVRQVIGWREFVRGIYWHAGPSYGEGNALGHGRRLPVLYWTADTDMRCLRESVGEVLQHGFGHHIQRLMVTGNFALLGGVAPREVSDWYLGMFVDGVDWVTLPNTLGMSQYADGGVVATKPYVASGQYLRRMSDYCRGCRFDPGARTGEAACPFTTFYWDFLLRHEGTFARNRRMALPLKHVAAMGAQERRAITQWAGVLRARLGLSDADA